MLKCDVFTLLHPRIHNSLITAVLHVMMEGEHPCFWNGPRVSEPLCEEFSCFAETYLLSEGPESYHYLSQSGCVQDNSLDDKQLFDSVMVR